MATTAATSLAASRSTLTGAGSVLGGQLQQRLAALKVKYERGNAEVATELDKLSRTHRPSRFAFGVVAAMAVGIDVLNYLVDILLVADLCLAVILLLCIRSLINRSVGAQRLLGAMMLVSLAISVLIPVFGSLIGGPILLVVLLFGMFNRGVQVNKVNKEKVAKSIENFGLAVQKARKYAARLIKLGRRTKGLRGLTTAIARSKAFRTFSKSSKTTGRLAAGAAAESIPFLAWIPFNTINAFWTYFDLKKAHIEAQEMLAEYRQQEAAAVAAESALIRAQYTEQMTGIVQQAIQNEQEEEEREIIQQQEEQSQRQSARVLPFRPAAAPADRPARPVMRDVGPAPALQSGKPAQVAA